MRIVSEVRGQLPAFRSLEAAVVMALPLRCAASLCRSGPFLSTAVSDRAGGLRPSILGATFPASQRLAAHRRGRAVARVALGAPAIRNWQLTNLRLI